ncbi:unnamed protein product [Strongylus vulgaris]|uniref:Uncharacterized protein n=1 Tax=Strongylus vulgaris TaxID=40348 RepID=A0A3P7JFT3_STRVU|nr:unnamed protein product [Strongylus vulgaris]
MAPSFEKAQARVAQLTTEKTELMARIAVRIPFISLGLRRFTLFSLWKVKPVLHGRGTIKVDQLSHYLHHL